MSDKGLGAVFFLAMAIYARLSDWPEWVAVGNVLYSLVLFAYHEYEAGKKSADE